jgi:integrase
MLFRVYSRYVPNLTRQDGSAMERLLASQLSQGILIQKTIPDKGSIFVPAAETSPMETPKLRGVHGTLMKRAPAPGANVNAKSNTNTNPSPNLSPAPPAPNPLN